MEEMLFLCWAQSHPIIDERWDFRLPITSDCREVKHSGRYPPAQPALCRWPLGTPADLAEPQTQGEVLWIAGLWPCSHWTTITQGPRVNAEFGHKILSKLIFSRQPSYFWWPLCVVKYIRCLQWIFYLQFLKSAGSRGVKITNYHRLELWPFGACPFRRAPACVFVCSSILLCLYTTDKYVEKVSNHKQQW